MQPNVSIKRDNQIIASGGFWCEACLSGKPSSEQSPDPRYCQGCYDYLLKEAEMLEGARRPSWIPRKPQSKPKKTQQNEKIETSKPCRVSEDVSPILSTLNDRKIKVDRIQPTPTPKRGRKHRDLPEELIWEFASEGMGSKAIATKLKKRGIVVSYKTIQRILSGERKHIVI